MSGKLLFDINGDLYRAISYEKLNEEDLNRELSEAKDKVTDVQEAIDFSNKLQSATDEPAPEAPVETPAPAVEAPAPEAPVAEVPSVPEVETTTPEPTPEVPTVEEAPVLDPASAPAPAPIVLN